MLKNTCVIVFLFSFAIFRGTAAQPARIITLSGALTETVDALGLGSHIVATDVTSIYPAYVNKLPRVSKNRSVSAEGLMSFRPDLILAPAGDVPREMQQQLKAMGIKLVNIDQEYSAKGALRFIREVSVAVQLPEKGEALAAKTSNQINQALASVKAKAGQRPNVLFIYARGAGTMSVAGKGSSLEAIISLAGGRNAVQEFNDFKPYSTEALVKANPDVILLFDFGLSSLGGANAVLKMPGMALTNAGKNKRIIQMDGQLLVNFSVRLADAITKLNSLLFL